MESCEHNQENCACPCHIKHHECCHGDHNFSAEMKANIFLGLADEAWQEVLKDKIKEYILKTQNDRMDKLAKIVAEGNHHRWINKMEKKQGCHDFMEEPCKFFEHSKK